MITGFKDSDIILLSWRFQLMVYDQFPVSSVGRCPVLLETTDACETSQYSPDLAQDWVGFVLGSGDRSARPSSSSPAPHRPSVVSFSQAGCCFHQITTVFRVISQFVLEANSTIWTIYKLDGSQWWRLLIQRHLELNISICPMRVHDKEPMTDLC